MVVKLTELAVGDLYARGFKFAAYAEIDTNGQPVGEAIAIGYSDSYGAVALGPLVEFRVGQTYYVFEEMTAEQAKKYKYDTENNPFGYVEVVALPDPLYNKDKATEFHNDLRMGVIHIDKQIETEDGYAPGEGFEFAVYAQIDANGQPIGSPIAYATSDADGKAVFGPQFAGSGSGTRSVFTPGAEYFVFEIMTEEQEAIYEFGEQGAYVAVLAIEEDDAVSYNAFFNDIIEVVVTTTGSLNVTGSVHEEYYREYCVPVYGARECTETIVSWNSELPSGFEGYTYGNGMTYFRVDASTLEACGGADIVIANSDPSNHPQGGSYNVKIADGRLMASIDFTALGKGWGMLLSDTSFAGGKNPVSGVTHSHQSLKEYDLTGKINSEGYFYLFFHAEGAGWVTSVYYDFDNRSTEKFSRPHAGDVTITVGGYEGGFGLVENLDPGIYTVTVFAGDIEVGSLEVTVVAGETTEVDFGTLVIPNYLGAAEQYGLPEDI